MKFRLAGIGYLEGAQVVTVTLCALDAQDVEHTIQAQWPVREVPELDTLFLRAIKQVGGDLTLKVMDADEAAKNAEPESAPVVIDITKNKDVAATVNKHVERLLEERAERQRIAEEEARAAEEALNRTEDSN
jgi:hypothetical protein